MLQSGGEPDLALETLGAHGAPRCGMEHLEGDGPVVAEVVGEPDDGHAALPELPARGGSDPSGPRTVR
jgi:hypothetical protein